MRTRVRILRPAALNHRIGRTAPARQTDVLRQDLLDEAVWTEVLWSLEEAPLIHPERDRRLASAQAADSTLTRTQAVERDLARAAHQRLAKTLSAFLTCLRASAETLAILERQRIVRLLVKEVSSATTRS